VTNTTALITLQPGEYRLYSTKQLKDPLPVEIIDLPSDEVILYPNPAKDSFKIKRSAKKVEIYDFTGRMIKSFTGDFNPERSYDISTLIPSVYVVKISSEKGVYTQRLVLD
jgi:hypothetical protein